MRKVFAFLLTFVLIFSLSAPAFAQESDIQHVYSSEANSGIRHEVCTTLEGTTADTYYTGQYTFDTLSGLSGDALLQSLRQLMTSTHTHKTTYDDCRDYAVKTDCENGDGTTINLLYSSFVTNRQGYINDTKKGWNREHVWPVSLGEFSKNETAGCDLHHIRPTDSSLNSQRGNEKYGIPTNGHAVTGTVVTNNALGGYSDNTYYEPLDNVKGDVARICLYMYVRYGSEFADPDGDNSGCDSITHVFQSIEVLLQWHEADPVDTWEIGRNEVVYAIQGNRNVFIDYPELAWLLFDKEIPSDITTPSGSTCTHQNTTVDAACEASCGQDGYSGDTYCTDCGKLVATGEAIPATGEHSFGDWETTKEATVDAPGLQIRSCTVCAATEEQELPKLEPVPTDPTPTEPAPTEPVHTQSNGNTVWIIVVILGILAASGAVYIFIIKKKQ